MEVGSAALAEAEAEVEGTQIAGRAVARVSVAWKMFLCEGTCVDWETIEDLQGEDGSTQ